MIMLTNTSVENARLFAEKLRGVIAVQKVFLDRPGHLQFRRRPASAEDNDDRFTQRVDLALYQAKMQGRNRVAVG